MSKNCLFLSAQKYQDGYLASIQFDNVYITKYFRKIDARRKFAEKHTLLPLKKMEKSGFIDPHSLKLFPKEKSHVVSSNYLIHNNTNNKNKMKNNIEL